jgi:hypothetical protein
MTSTARPIAGWYRDPAGEHALRYWDGAAWTHRVRDDTMGLRPATTTATPPEIPIERIASAPAVAEPAASLPVAAGATARWPVVILALVAGGAVLLALGAVLPWREVQVGNVSASRAGVDGDGALVIVLGAGILILLVVLEASRRLAWLLLALSIGAAGFALFELVDTSRKADDFVTGAADRAISASVGIGPWVSLAGALVVLFGAVVALVRRAPAQAR